jgi:hypothetical protein
LNTDSRLCDSARRRPNEATVDFDISPDVCSRAVPGRLCIIISLALLTWILPVAHSMPIDADGPSGFSDNGDFDDLIVSLTSPTAAVAPAFVVITAICLDVVDAVAPPKPIQARSLIRSSVESRAPPLV